MTNALFAFGTLLKIGDGATPTEGFTTIAEVTNIGGPGFSMDTPDVTSHSSANKWREFIAGLLDAGEVTFTINFIPTNATHSQTSGLLKDMKNRTKRNFQLVFPDSGATTWTLPTFITGFEPGEPIDNALTADVTLKVAGEPTLAG